MSGSTERGVVVHTHPKRSVFETLIITCLVIQVLVIVFMGALMLQLVSDYKHTKDQVNKTAQGLDSMRQTITDQAEALSTLSNQVTTGTKPTVSLVIKAQDNIKASAVLGNTQTAIAAIIEYSDYECPFCKRHFTQTVPQIIKNYVDSGKVIYVYRNFPLSIHQPNATDEALAAECVRNVGNMSQFWTMHDLIFTTTTSNKGLTHDKLYDLAVQAGVDRNQFTQCFDTKQTQATIDADIKAGQALGINGTPSFVIGTYTLSTGAVDGVLDKRGAVSYDEFVKALGQYLK